ncbi:UNVERIFIED_ORG: hypothetical protein J2W85_006182 [Ensifer adhaerens]|nr:hypothetical protein [Ensifer adhaerens]
MSHAGRRSHKKQPCLTENGDKMRPSIATGRVARRSLERILIKQPAQESNGMLQEVEHFMTTNW